MLGTIVHASIWPVLRAAITAGTFWSGTMRMAERSKPSASAILWAT